MFTQRSDGGYDLTSASGAVLTGGLVVLGAHASHWRDDQRSGSGTCRCDLYSRPVQIDVLAISDCPNLRPVLNRVHTALANVGINDAAVCTFVVVDLAQAEAVGMHGTPTILIDGRDPFAVEDSVPSLSCRLYRSATGMSGGPTVDDLVEAMNRTVS